MKSKYVKMVLLLAILPLLFTFQVLAADGEIPVPNPAGPTVTLRAESGATILFKMHNGEKTRGTLSQALDLPLLVLYRNGRLTDAQERTLLVTVTGIDGSSGGVTLTLELTTQHGDPDLGGRPDQRIPVWRESQQLANPSGFNNTGGTAVFTPKFNETVLSGSDMIATPTDYFRYELVVTDMDHPLSNPLLTLTGEYAFLMENQWITQLPEVQELPPGAAPDELIVYYCDMFPFQKKDYDVSTRLLREDVSGYVSTELIPQMIEAFRIQTHEWGFAWPEGWTSYRGEEDGHRLSVALTDKQTWFHGMAPSRGHAGISLRVEGTENVFYDTLTEGLISTFHHELFHQFQQGISQNEGGDGNLSGKDGAWAFFIEGTAALASSVGQSSVQFAPTTPARAYVANANYFLGSDGYVGNLNTSYKKMYPQRAAMYWRFLYEQCGGMSNGVEDPAAGMQIIRRSLMTLYAGDIVDITASTSLVEKLPEIMDQALAGSACPFKTHAESLIAFARAIYALRLMNGRCTAPGTPAGCGFYDPHQLYGDPPVSTINYNGTQQSYSGEINSSFGIDFVEVILDPAT